MTRSEVRTLTPARVGALAQVIAVGALAGLLASCELSGISKDGPTPQVQSLARADASFPAEPVLCVDLPATLVLTGTDFSPLPSDVLTDAETLTMPAVTAVGSDGSVYTLEAPDFDQAASTLTVAIAAAALPPDTYDITVTNPNGNSVTVTDALDVVPPPTVESVDPASGANSAVTAVTITGTAFRTTKDGSVAPTVTLTLAGGSDSSTLTDVVVVSDTQITASVPAGLAPGIYDLTVQNPDGCAGTLASAFEVLAAPIDLVKLDPAFGWVQRPTTVEITASNAAGHGLIAVPEVFIIIDGVQVPLIREALLSNGTATGTSVMSAVVPASLTVGGPYDILVINPDGSRGTISGFTVLSDPPPDVVTVSPARGDKDAATTITIQGHDFKAGTLPETTTPILTIELVQLDTLGNEVVRPCGAATVTLDTPQAGTDTASCQITLPSLTGAYVVRVRHEDDHSFDLYASFAVTEPSRKLNSATSTLGSLNVARRAHGVAVGEDDLGNQFIYAVGGENSTIASLDSVELASRSKFGQLGAWTRNAQSLPQGRTGLSLVAAGRYLYAIGGSTDGSGPLDTATMDTVLRALILGSDTAPAITNASVDVTGTLAAGTYYYKVAADMGSATANPDGEGLPSDHETLRVPANGKVTLTWSAPLAYAVNRYRIYRSPNPDMLNGSEVLIATTADGTTTTFVDDGSPVPDMTRTPLPPGSTGKWVGVAKLQQTRFDAAATLVRLDADSLYLYVAGGRKGPVQADVLASVEVAKLAADGSSIATPWATTTDMTTPRAEHVLFTVGHNETTVVPDGQFSIVAVGGTSQARAVAGGGITAIAVGRIQTTPADEGKVLPWQGGSDATKTHIGGNVIVVNDTCYAFEGWGASPPSELSDVSQTAMNNSTTPGFPTYQHFTSATVGLPAGVKYRSGMVFTAAYFFFVGGSSDIGIGTTANVVARASY